MKYCSGSFIVSRFRCALPLTDNTSQPNEGRLFQCQGQLISGRSQQKVINRRLVVSLCLSVCPYCPHATITKILNGFS